MDIIAIDDDPILLHTVGMVLEDTFGEIQTYEHPGLASSSQLRYAKVLVLDLNFTTGEDDGLEGLAWIKKIKEQQPHLSIIVLTANGHLDIAVKALKQGATDFIEKPFSNEKLIATVHAALNMANTNLKLTDALEAKQLLAAQTSRVPGFVIGHSAGMEKVMDMAMKVADTEASVLITGEHGTGKEVLARFIHQHSARANQPFVQLELSAFSPNLFESTLFGHVKGAFTDASEDKAGLIEGANLGTLFLDDISELPLSLQSKLLAALQNREISRVGEHRPRAIDVRVISASKRSLEDLNDPGIFRQDLLFRINTIHVEIPPLRFRKNDIKPLTAHFLDLFNRKYHRDLKLNKDQLSDFVDYTWPGNVRELRNTLERMVIMNDTAEIFDQDNSGKKEDNLYELEKTKIAEVIKMNGGNITHAAAALGIGRNTLYRKMKKYGL